MRKPAVVISVFLMVLSAAFSCSAANAAPAFLAGTFLIEDGRPMSGALMFVYDPRTGPAPSMDKYWRVPDHSKALKDDGSIDTAIPEGTYYFGAVQRRSGTTRIGPPEEGDFFLLSLDNSGLPKKHQLKMGERLDIGTISGARQIKTSFFDAPTTAIEGSIQDAEGKPVAGVMAFAFLTPQVSGKPLFSSERSSRDGRFVLAVPEGGTYYLKVRDGFGGGPPVVGKLLDGDRKEPLPQVTVETGKTARIGILKVKKFPGRGRDNK